MIFWLVLGLTLVVLIAPLRERLLRHGAWRLTLPLLVGVLVAYRYLGTLPSGLDAPWIWVTALVFGALIVAGILWTCLNEVLGPPRNRR